MAVKDRYGNNLLKGRAVTDLRREQTGVGRVVATTMTDSVVVEWPNGEEETVQGKNLSWSKRGL